MKPTVSPASVTTLAGTHLSDDRLIDVSLGGTPDRHEVRHLEGCSACEGRRADVVRLLADCSDAAAAGADAAFPPDRLARQRARILQRLDEEMRPGRVITFPAARATDVTSFRSRPGMRWIAAAAAAGLVIGVLAGYATRGIAGRPAPAARIAALAPESEPILRAVPTSLAEEEFLGLVEIAIEDSSASALRPLDDLTPRVWDVAAR